MKDNTKIIGELIELSQTPEQVLFLKELDTELIIEREERYRMQQAESNISKTIHRDIIATIIDRINRY